jgi:alkaline phosphatase
MSARGGRIVLGALAALTAGAGGAAAEGPEKWLRQGRKAVENAQALRPTAARAKNAIIFVGDGMDLATVTAARILEGQFQGRKGEENLLAFEEFPYVALAKTYNTNQQVPDSAGTITAILSGAKTRAGVIGLDETVERGDARGAAGHELRNLFQEAEQRGLATGVVTTTSVTHATPAAAYAHSPERNWENDSNLSPAARAANFPDIARQLVEWRYGDGLDVILGGGRCHFLPTTTADPEYPDATGQRGDGRNLIAEWQKRHPKGRSIWNRAEFDAVDPAKTRNLLGLSETSHMQFDLDRSKDNAGEPSLTEMTEKAIAILARNPKGYVLLVEGGRIDHAHHLGNAHRALVGTIAMSDAVRTAREKTSEKDTLIVVTADHGHVLSISGYPTRGNPILGKVLENDERGEPSTEFARDLNGLPYTTLGYQNGPGARKARPDLSAVDTTEPEFRQESLIPLPHETHSGEDVPVYADGPGGNLFHGVQEQSYLYHAIVEALGWYKPDE